MNRECKFGVLCLRGPDRLKAELQTSKSLPADFTQEAFRLGRREARGLVGIREVDETALAITL